jgi:hypothetical protein
MTCRLLRLSATLMLTIVRGLLPSTLIHRQSHPVLLTRVPPTILELAVNQAFSLHHPYCPQFMGKISETPTSADSPKIKVITYRCSSRPILHLQVGCVFFLSRTWQIQLSSPFHRMTPYILRPQPSYNSCHTTCVSCYVRTPPTH